MMIEENLKIAIEEIVAPISADPRLKDRYREELLGHSLALIELDRNQGGNEAKCVEVALERLGDPETLRGNFVQSLSRLDRAYGKVEKFYEKRPDESSLRFALRGSALFGLGVALFIVTLFTPTIAGITWFAGPKPDVVIFLPVFGLFAVLYCAAVVFFALLIATQWDKVRLEKKWGLFTLYACFMGSVSIMSGVVCVSIGHVILAFLLGSRHPSIDEFYAVAGVTIVGATLSLIPAIGFMAQGKNMELVIRGRRYKRIPDWPYRNDA